MSRLDVSAVVGKVEENLIRDYIISADFSSITSGNINHRRRRMIVFRIALVVLLVIISAVAFLGEKESKLHIYAINSLYGYGYLGKIWNGIYFIGDVGIVGHAVVFFVTEGRGRLTVVTELKRMFQRLENPSKQETKDFLYYLKIIVYVRELSFIAIIVPMTAFRLVGGVITAYEFQSVSFLVVSCISIIPFAVAQEYLSYIHVYTHLIMAQSATYLILRLNRIDKHLQSVVASSVSQMHHKVFSTTVVVAMHKMNRQVIELQKVLNEVGRHNENVKQWLGNDLLTVGGVLTFCFIQCLDSPIPWYWNVCTFSAVPAWIAIMFIPFLNAAKLHLKIRSMSKVLYSCQTLLQREAQSKTQRPRSALSTKPMNANPVDVLKTKYKILRVIHRVSSPFLRIGFTERDGDSFSPSSIIRLLSTVAFNSLMFLNARNSTLKYLLHI